MTLNRKAGCIAVLIAASACVLPAQAYDHEFWLKAEIRIGTDGHVESLDWRGKGEAANPVTERLERMIRAWKFEPGKIDGVAAPTDTFLTLQVLGEEHDDGSMNLSLGDVRTGAVLETITPPRFPPNEARSGNSAHLVATLEISADGQVRVADVEVEARRPGSGDAFVESLKDVVVEWKPALERVGGVPVASTLQMPVQFCGPDNTGWCVNYDRERMERLRAKQVPTMPASDAIALESAVKLLTPVRGNDI